MITFVTQDLMLASRVKSHAQSQGVDLSVTPRLPPVETIDPDVQRVLIDLQSVGDELADWVATVRSGTTSLQIVGYAPHVQTQLLERATLAGLDQVMTRGQFDRAIPKLLAAGD